MPRFLHKTLKFPSGLDSFDVKKKEEAEYDTEEDSQIRNRRLESIQSNYASEFGYLSERKTLKQRASKVVHKFGLHVLTMPLFYLYTSSYILFAASYFSCLTYLVPYGKSGEIQSLCCVCSSKEFRLIRVVYFIKSCAYY